MRECPGCGGLGTEECVVCEGEGVDPLTGDQCSECWGDGETECEQCEGNCEIDDDEVIDG
jgi:hypothetical protein